MSGTFLVRNLAKSLKSAVNFGNARSLCSFTKCSEKLQSRSIHDSKPVLKKAEVKVTFIRASGERLEATGKVGDSLLDVVVDQELDIDGYGACEGTLTCSTCHVILKKNDYDSLPEKPVDEEMDMLDLAHGLTDTSRLGCQITLTEDLNGLEVSLPASINDARK